MGIQFNGTVTIKGNVEMYDNGSMKITNNQYTVNINELKNLINEQLKYSPNKKEYLEAVDIIINSTDKSLIKNAILKIRNLGLELGKNILISGLSTLTIEVLKEIGTNGI